MSSRTKAIAAQTKNWPALRRATRLGQAAVLFSAALVGVSCADGARPMGPLSPFNIGGKMKYDSIAPAELKNAARLRTLSGGNASRFLARSLNNASSAAESGILATFVPFAPEPGPFTNLFIECEDCMLSQPDADGYPIYDPSGTPLGFPIGFNFTFFGNTYDRFYFSTNGFVTFTHQYDGCCEGYVIPNADAVNDVIAIAWGDLSPKFGQAAFETRGQAPNRRLIVNLSDVELFAEPTVKVTAQLILYEGSNVIELHTRSQGQSAFQKTTQGIENAAGTEAVFVDGRVSDYYTLSNDGVRFAAPAGTNRAPSVDAGGNAGGPPVDHYVGREGSPISFKALAADADNDPLTYRWDFNADGVADAEGAEATYTYPDNGAFTARVTVTDSHNQSGTAAIDVMVENVKPTAVLQAPDAVDEGSPIVISVGDLVDPSPADREAGFQFAFDCGQGFGEFGPTSSASCTTVDNGTRTVGLKVRDKDGEETSSTKSVNIRNVAPVVELAKSLSGVSGQVVGLSARFTDVGVADKLWHWSWSSTPTGTSAERRHGNSSGSGTAAEQGRTILGAYPACGAGAQVVTLAVVDKDGGRGVATVTINVERMRVEMRVKPNVVALNSRDSDEDSDSDDAERWNDDHGRLVTVHLLSSAGFDATSIDPASVTLTNGTGKGTPVAKKKKGRKAQEEWVMKVAHLNGDRVRDVKLSFSRAALMANGDLNASTTSLSLVGRAGGCSDVVAAGSVIVKP